MNELDLVNHTARSQTSRSLWCAMCELESIKLLLPQGGWEACSPQELAAIRSRISDCEKHLQDVKGALRVLRNGGI